ADLGRHLRRGVAPRAGRRDVRHDQGEQHDQRVLELKLAAAAGPALLEYPDDDPEQDLEVEYPDVNEGGLATGSLRETVAEPADERHAERRERGQENEPA